MSVTVLLKTSTWSEDGSDDWEAEVGAWVENSAELFSVLPRPDARDLE